MLVDVDVGAVTDFPVGKFVLRDVDGIEVGIVRLPGDTFRAVRNVCPHRGAPICYGQVGGTMLPSEPGQLVFGREFSVLRCPWHGWEFDLDSGENIFGGVRGKLRLYRVFLRESRVVVIR